MDLYSLLPNHVAQIKHLCEAQLALGHFGIELLLLQNPQHLLQVLQVLLPSPAIDQDVVKEHQHISV